EQAALQSEVLPGTLQRAVPCQTRLRPINLSLLERPQRYVIMVSHEDLLPGNDWMRPDFAIGHVDMCQFSVFLAAGFEGDQTRVLRRSQDDGTCVHERGARPAPGGVRPKRLARLRVGAKETSREAEQQAIFENRRGEAPAQGRIGPELRGGEAVTLGFDLHGQQTFALAGIIN